MKPTESVYKEFHHVADDYGILGFILPSSSQRKRYQFMETIALLLADDVKNNHTTLDDHCLPIFTTRVALSEKTGRPDEAIQDAIRNISRRTGYSILIKLQ